MIEKESVRNKQNKENNMFSTRIHPRYLMIQEGILSTTFFLFLIKGMAR